MTFAKLDTERYLCKVFLFSMILLLLLLSSNGCRNHTGGDSPRSDTTPTREELIETARGQLIQAGLYEQGDYLKIDFDVDNRKWQEVFTRMERDDPEEAREFHKMLDGRSYQAIHFAHDPAGLDGAYWVFVDLKAKRIIMFGAGL